ncbi:MAG: hypothetical protein J5992_04575 [Oscillospiraceae bacterium]|nr:hypothetical protein [Oscillospiraceae bacterium]
MKKILTLMIVAAMAMSITACSKKPDTAPETTTTPEVTTVPEETTTVETESSDVVTEEVTDAPADTAAPDASADTLGNTLYKDFLSKVEANPDMSVEELANQIIANPVIQFGPAVMPVEAGYLPGFTEEISGFKSGAMFAPMIGSIPFVGYVFELESEDDVEAFLATLDSTSDPRWNVCVEADETVMGNSGTKVFFVMCPTSIEG